MRYGIVLSYDGGGFRGWQSQRGGGTVQDAVEAAVFKLFGEKTRVTGSGRTDAGVHALGQVAHFDCEKVLPTKNVVGGLNAYLPKAVRVLEAFEADGSFDARRSVKKKTYMYVMYTGAAHPVLDGRAWCTGPLDADKMQSEAKRLIGRHDFATFMAAGGGAKTSTRTVFDARLERADDGFIKFYITADGFLYNMVRIIAAQLVKCGRGGDVDISALIEKKDRAFAKEVAPPGGLYLYKVEYGSGL